MLSKIGALGIAATLLAVPAGAVAQQGEEGAPAAEPADSDAPPSPEETAEAAEGVPAGDDAAPAEASGETGGEVGTAGAASVEDEQKLAELEHDRADEPRAPSDPFERPDETYYFVGAFYEHTWTPSPFIKLFTDLAPSANNHGTGLEFITRKDGMSILARLYWQGGFADGAFRGPGDDVSETEIVHSDLWAVMASATFLWSTAFNDVVALEYGIGVGIGGVGGNLTRTEAYQDGEGKWQECRGRGDPPSGAFCGDNDSEHYDFEPDNWFGGGSIPALWFRLDLPHLALRIKPVKQFMMRIDFGFQVPMGPFVGLTAAYGI